MEVPVSVYDQDPDTGLPREPAVPEPVRCPDGGTCHHECRAGCFRATWCGPLSGVFPGDRWPEDVRAGNRRMGKSNLIAALLEPGTGPAALRTPAFSDDDITGLHVRKEIEARKETAAKMARNGAAPPRRVHPNWVMLAVTGWAAFFFLLMIAVL
jgi:hypothetical protein